MSDYATFLEAKRHSAAGDGVEVAPEALHPKLFDFQRALTQWALAQGRCALFADCGLGKTLMQLEWAQHVVRATNGRVLILTPLAVAQQTIREAGRFGYDAAHVRERSSATGILVTNYERLHHFDARDFAGVVCDESSILKSFDGVRRAQITAFMRKTRYRLLCTATAAPNDYVELGTSSEALGLLGHMDMLHRFFVNDQHSAAARRSYGKVVRWRLKGHAHEPFWRWVCGWARALRKPSDMAFADDGFVLPSLTEREHCVVAKALPDGMLFALPAAGMREQREERRRTIAERCEKAASLVAGGEPALVWCHLNSEGDALERAIPGAVQVSGKESDDAKEAKLSGFANGDFRVLITKPKIGAWGLNFQHCAHVTFFPSHSFEQYYQGVRRCWRFGQKRPVVVDVVSTEGERDVLTNLRRKAAAADAMFVRLVALMHDALHVAENRGPQSLERIPSWL